MFRKGQKLKVSVRENGSVTEYMNCTVLDYEDGLLKLHTLSGEEVVYNVHSSDFVKATKQD